MGLNFYMLINGYQSNYIVNSKVTFLSLNVKSTLKFYLKENKTKHVSHGLNGRMLYNINCIYCTVMLLQ